MNQQHDRGLAEHAVGRQPATQPAYACPNCGGHRFNVEMYSRQIEVLRTDGNDPDGEWDDRQERIDTIYLSATCRDCETDVTEGLGAATSRAFEPDAYKDRFEMGGTQ